jgi:hypothetical protein
MLAIKNKNLSLGPRANTVVDLGQVVEGHITALLSAISDPEIPQHILPQDFKLELLRSGTVVATAVALAVSIVNDSPSQWQVRVTSKKQTGLLHFNLRIEFPVPEQAATLEAYFKVDESQGGTLRHWQAIVLLPPLSPGTITAQRIDAPFGSRLTLEFMVGPQVLASAHDQLLALDLSSGAPPLTLRITCDTPPSETTSVTVRVLYPSTRRVLTKQIPLQFFARVFEEFWNERVPQPLSLSITDHNLSITFDPALKREQNLEDVKVSLPSMSLPTGNDVKIMGMFSRSIRLSASIGPNPANSIRVAPAPPHKYPQAACFAVDVVFEEPGPHLDVNNLPDIAMHNVSLRLEFYLSDLGTSIYFFPNAIVKIGSAEFIEVGVATHIETTAREGIMDALARGTTMARYGDAMRPWLLGEPYTVMAAGSRFGEILIDYVEPPPQVSIPTPRTAVQPGNLSRVKHIVVLMMENRSFDHMLGYLSLTPRAPGQPVNGLTGSELNHFNGQVFPTHLLPTTLVEISPPHGFVPTHNQITDHMGGFVAAFAKEHESQGADVSVVMGHYDGKLLPVYHQLAAQFAICDKWHAAHPGPTWPNRFITLTGRLNQDAFGQFELDNPDLSNFTPAEATTIFDILSANNVSWRYYENGYSFIRLFTRYTFDIKNVLGFSSFLSDAAAGTLSQVTFIDPDFIEFPPGADDQAPSDPIDGQIFVGTVVNALLASPAWADTLLIATYDEHGGFFDHVEPPATPVKFEGDMDHYGLRVPTFIVSPYVEPGDVSTQVFDHASILATIQRAFLGPQAPDLGPRVSHAADVGSLLGRTAPRTGIPPLELPRGTEGRRARRVQLPFPNRGSREFNDLLFMARMFTGIGPK